MALLNYTRDFESGTILTTDSPSGDWTGIEEHRSSQHAVVTPDGLSGRPPAHPGFSKVAYVEETTGDEWGTTGFYRCLIQDAAQSTNRPRNGDEAWFATAIYIPLNSVPTGPLLWELHNILGLGSIAPFAIEIGPFGAGKNWKIVGNSYVSDDANTTRRVAFRQATGNCTDGVPGKNVGTLPYLYQCITIPGLDLASVYDTWINFIVHIVFKEDTTGYYELWAVAKNSPTSSDFVEASPTLKKTGVPTCQWDSVTNTHDAMYLETGLYTGGTNPSSLNKVYHAGTRVRPSFADAVTALTGAIGGDTTPPALQDLRVASDGTITLSFNEALDATSVPATGDFAVTVNGASLGMTNVTIGGAAGALVTLAYPSGSIINTDVVVLSYTPGVHPLRDSSLNSVVAINQTAVNQLSPAGLVFGKVTPGDSTLGNLGNYKRCSPFTLAQDAQITAIGHYVRGGTTSADTATIKFVVYADSNGPSTLVATSPSYTLAGNAAEGWREVTLSSPVSVSAGTYWLGEHYSGNTNVYATDISTVSGAEALRVDTYSDGASNPWSASEGGGYTGTYDNQFSIYARLQNLTANSTGRVYGTRVAGSRVSGTRS